MKSKQSLRECKVFSALDDATLEEILNGAVEKQYEAGTTLFEQGDSANELFILQEGKVALQMALPKGQQQAGRRITIDIVTTNEIIGWSAIIEPHIYTLAAVCLQKVAVLSLSGSGLRWLLQDNPKIGFEVLKEITKVVASRLDDTRQVLISERLLTQS